MTKTKLIYQVTHKQTPKNKAKDVVGEAYQGSCEKVLKDKNFQKKYKGKIDLIFFSPPFALNNKKSYGNTEGEAGMAIKKMIQSNLNSPKLKSDWFAKDYFVIFQ